MAKYFQIIFFQILTKFRLLFVIQFLNMSSPQASSPTAAAASATVKQSRNVGHFFKRIFELFWLLLATLAALFFFKTAQEANDENLKLRDELRRGASKKDSTNKCSVCLGNPVEVVLQPCGHVCLCLDCVVQLSSPSANATDKRCPICRTKITSHHKIFLS